MALKYKGYQFLSTMWN